MAAFSERLRKLRESLNLSQNEFSKQLGVSRVSLTHYEAGDRTPDIDFLCRLHQYTGVSVYYLLGLTDSKDDTLATAQRNTGLCEEALVLLSNNTIVTDCINMMAQHDILSKACAYIAILYNDHIRKKEIPETKWTNGMETHRRESIDFLLADLKVMIEQAAQNNSADPIANIDENELPCRLLICQSHKPRNNGVETAPGTGRMESRPGEKTAHLPSYALGYDYQDTRSTLDMENN